MKYNFDEIIDRRNTCCLKYDYAVERGRPADVLPLWVADMDFRTPPEVVEALKERIDHGIFGYTQPKSEYYNTVVNWFQNRHGWTPAPSGFVPSCSVVFALGALLRTFTRSGDAVIICQPVYYPFENIVKQNGRELVVSELVLKNGRYEVDFEDFERKITEHGVKAFILCSPHNPVGRVWTREELERMGDICTAHGVFIISDEIHADFTYEGHRHIPFASLKPEYEKNLAVCTAPTKTFNLAGLQICNIYIPEENARTMYKAELDRLGYSEPAVLGMVACKAAYEQGGAWLDELLGYLKGNLDMVRMFLQENLPEITLIEPEGTYLAWLDCRALGLTDEKLQALVEQKAGLWLDDGYIFGKGGSGFERINMACPRATLKEALEKLKSALR